MLSLSAPIQVFLRAITQGTLKIVLSSFSLSVNCIKCSKGATADVMHLCPGTEMCKLEICFEGSVLRKSTGFYSEITGI